MARYIDADKMVSKDNAYTTFPHDLAGCDDNDLVRWINEQPTADVVPKSEAEKLNKEFDELAEEHSDLIVEKDQLFVIAEMQKIEIEALKIANEKMYAAIEATKAEVAREIFEEIEEVFRQHTEGGYYLNGAWFHERLDLYTGDAIAELKKKYTEGEPNGSK